MRGHDGVDEDNEIEVTTRYHEIYSMECQWVPVHISRMGIDNSNRRLNNKHSERPFSYVCPHGEDGLDLSVKRDEKIFQEVKDFVFVEEL